MDFYFDSLYSWFFVAMALWIHTFFSVSQISCTSGNSDFEFSNPNTDDTQDQNKKQDSAEPEEELTYYRDIRPLVDLKCIQCHYEGGRSFDMNAHDVFVGMAEYIARDVRDGGKPPPISNNECQSYIGDHRFVTEDDKILLENFYQHGAVIGDVLDASDYIPPQGYENPEQEFDILLSIDSTYPFPSNEGHKCTVFDIQNDTAITLLSTEFFTNDIRKSWTSTLFLAPADYERQHGEHFDCQFSGEADWDVLASWSPAVPPIEYGDGIVLEPNTKIILKQYWFPEQGGFDDFVGYWGLQTTSDIPERPTEIVKFDILDFVLPAGQNNILIQEDFDWNLGEKSIVGAYFRSSQLGMGGQLHITSQQDQEQETECLLDYYLYEPLVPQHIMYKNPPSISNQNHLSLSCSYDNSSGNKKQVFDPPQNLEQTYNGDMALCFVTLYIR